MFQKRRITFQSQETTLFLGNDRDGARNPSCAGPGEEETVPRRVGLVEGLGVEVVEPIEDSAAESLVVGVVAAVVE
jgi:hypothetical protein